MAPFADGLPSSQERTVSSIMLRLSAGPLLCVAHREGPFKGPARSAHGVEPALRGSAEFVPGAVRSEEHTSELQSLMRTSYAGFCLNKKNTFFSHLLTYIVSLHTLLHHILTIV